MLIYHREVEASIKEMSVPAADSKPLKFASTYSRDQFSQFRLCLWKQNLVYWRSPHYTAVRIFFTTGAAFIFGSVFWDIGLKKNTTQGLLTVMGALYSACLFLGVNNASSVQPIISIERTVFYRERAAGMYAPFAYAAAQVSMTHYILGSCKSIEQSTDKFTLLVCNRDLLKFHTFLRKQFYLEASHISWLTLRGQLVSFKY